MFPEVPLDDWKVYCRWHLLLATASGLPKRFEDEAFSFWGVKVGGQKEQKARWKRVAAAAGGSIGHLVGQLYVKDHFPPEAKAAVENLVDRLLVEMGNSIDAVDWMSDETKAQAKIKLDGFGYKIGYPDVWRDYSALDISRDTWLGNRLAARAFEADRNIATLGKPLDRQCVLLAGTERDRVPGRDLAATVLLIRSGRRSQLRRYRCRDRP
jgi:putative endopeptidase